MFEFLVTFAIDAVSTLGYPGIISIMALENIFPPIPSEAVMPLAGFLVTTGRFTLLPTIICGVIGSIIGAIILYYFGVIFSGDKIRTFLDNYGKYFMTSTEDLDAAEKWFTNYGYWAVLIARVIPIVRSIISIPAGFTKMPMGKFLALTTLGTAAWTAFLTVLGVILGENWNKVGPTLQKFDYLVLVIIVLGISYYIISKLRAKRKQRY